MGLKGYPALPKIEVNNLPKSAIVTDIVYNPLETKLLKDARIRGLKIVYGLGMLIYQAIPGFKLWFEQEPEVDKDLIKLLNENL